MVPKAPRCGDATIEAPRCHNVPQSKPRTGQTVRRYERLIRDTPKSTIMRTFDNFQVALQASIERD